MDDTSEVRRKILALWAKFDNGKLPISEARTHIGFARTIMETLKVEIAAAHLAQVAIPAVPISEQKPVAANGKKKLAA